MNALQPTIPSHLDLIRAAVSAPSPDNNQPWRFASGGDDLWVYLDPHDALPSDVNSMFDLMGVGAAIENARIAARHSGFETEVHCLAAKSGDSTELRAVARLGFRAGAGPDPLWDLLSSRSTCRKLYSSRTVPQAILDRLATASAEFSGVRLDWVGDRRRIRAFAGLVAQSDRFRFEYEPFHHEIFRQLRFTAQEAESTKDGLDVRTLDLPPGAAILLRLLRSWNRMRWVHVLRLTGLLTVPSAISVLRSGALGVLSLPETGPSRFIEGGRAFQRIWLAAEAEGLALQPLGSLPIFLGQVEQLGGRNLTPAHRQLSLRLGAQLRRLVPETDGRTILMLFRLGRSARPRIRSLRRQAETSLVDIGAGFPSEG